MPVGRIPLKILCIDMRSGLLPLSLDPATGIFSYTRRNPSLTGLSYAVWISKDLVHWELNGTGGSQTPDSEAAATQTVTVVVDAAPLAPLSGEMFVRVSAQ